MLLSRAPTCLQLVSSAPALLGDHLAVVPDGDVLVLVDVEHGGRLVHGGDAAGAGHAKGVHAVDLGKEDSKGIKRKTNLDLTPCMVSTQN